MLIEKILETLPQGKTPVRAITSGLHWTAVSSRFCGLASSLWSEGLTAPAEPDTSALLQLSAQELASYALSENHLESAVGMAAINSLLDPFELDPVELNAHDWLLSEGIDKNIAIIGHFPFVDRIKPVARNLWVIEKNPRPGDYPASESRDLLPRADIVAITGSSFVNHSIDEVLSYCSPRSIVMVLGPSTPLAPVLFDYGISILSGSFVTDEPAVIEGIRAGATYQRLQGVKRITLRKP